MGTGSHFYGVPIFMGFPFLRDTGSTAERHLLQEKPTEFQDLLPPCCNSITSIAARPPVHPSNLLMQNHGNPHACWLLGVGGCGNVVWNAKVHDGGQLT